MRNDINRQLLVEQRVTNEAKSPLVAYLLLFLLWGSGVHRMYLGRWASGIIMLLLWAIGWITAWLLVGFIPIALVTIWLVLDIFLIPGMIRDDNAVNRQRLMADMAR